MSCRPTIQTNQFDSLSVPPRLAGLVAPVVVWEYIDQLQRRIAKLEAALRNKAAHEATHKRWAT